MKLNLLPAEDPILRLECAEDLSLLEVQQADLALDNLLGPDCYRRRVLLNLARASYIDSAGVGWLLLCHKRFQEAGGCLVLHSLPPMVVHVFELLGLSSILNLADDEEAARALAERGRSAALSPPAHPV
jgi:anti-sigma B factor antagonist